MALTFELTDEQEKQWIEFKKLVDKTRLQAQIDEYKGKEDAETEQIWEARTCGWATPYTGAIGGGVDIVFTPTGVGNVVVFQCNSLGLSYNATDYDSW